MRIESTVLQQVTQSVSWRCAHRLLAHALCIKLPTQNSTVTRPMASRV